MSIKLIGCCIFLVAVIGVSVFSLPQKSCEEFLHDFYSNEGPEITQMDPLILAGNKIVPVVLDKIKDKNMPKRRYAIAFLGNGSYHQALPVLESIVTDNTEKDFFRSDALESIYLIDNDKGLQYARQFQVEANDLGEVSKDLLGDRKLLPKHRSYIAALASQLDR